MRIACIDIGTNTCLLLIAEIKDDNTYQILQESVQIVRLGEGIHNHHSFLDTAMERCLATLNEYSNLIKKHNCKEVFVVGTAAFRHAKNAADFVTKVAQQTGLNIEIISGEREAALIHLASVTDFSSLKKPILVLDIGGGSTEFILDDGEQIHKKSLNFGSVKLTERFLPSDIASESEINTLQSFVQKEVHQLDFLKPYFTNSTKNLNLIATAGTPTTISALSLGLKEYDPTKVHKSILTIETISSITDKLAQLPLAERSKLPCLPAKRADIIVAGSIILHMITKALGLNKIHVSDRGLRYGVLYERLTN
jgi:exopolyphosphatase / guanosine-5'-triphosphate,3'-diphosphate pyrophosphatase